MPVKFIPSPAKSSLIAVTLLLSIAGIESVENQNLFWGPLHDSAHALVAFLITSLCISLLKSEQQTSGLRLAQIGGALFAAGIAVELLQPAFGRSASFTDIYYNFAGIVSALAITISSRLARAPKISIVMASMILLTSCLTVPFIGAATLYQRDAKLPVLLDFEDNWQRRLYRAGGGANLSLTRNPKGWKNTSTTLKIDFPTTRYPGVSAPHIYRDWSDYDRLSFEVFSKNEQAHAITLRVHDEVHDHNYADRYNQRFSIHPGLNVIEINLEDVRKRPKKREMDMTSIAGFAIFSASPTETFSLYVDNFRLD